MANPCIENKKNMKNDPIPYIRIHRKKEKGKLDRNVVALCKTQLQKDLASLTQKKKDEIAKKYENIQINIISNYKEKKMPPLEQNKMEQITKAEDIIKKHKHKPKLKF